MKKMDTKNAHEILRDDAGHVFMDLIERAIFAFEEHREEPIIDARTAEAAVEVGEDEFARQTVLGFEEFLFKRENQDLIHKLVKKYNAPFYQEALRMNEEKLEEEAKKDRAKENRSKLYTMVDGLTDDQVWAVLNAAPAFFGKKSDE